MLNNIWLFILDSEKKNLLTQNTENISHFILYPELFFLNNTQYLITFHFLYNSQKKKKTQNTQ